jgi:hypothetical protein
MYLFLDMDVAIHLLKDTGFIRTQMTCNTRSGYGLVRSSTTHRWLQNTGTVTHMTHRQLIRVSALYVCLPLARITSCGARHIYATSGAVPSPYSALPHSPPILSNTFLLPQPPPAKLLPHPRPYPTKPSSYSDYSDTRFDQEQAQNVVHSFSAPTHSTLTSYPCHGLMV